MFHQGEAQWVGPVPPDAKQLPVLSGLPSVSVPIEAAVSTPAAAQGPQSAASGSESPSVVEPVLGAAGVSALPFPQRWKAPPVRALEPQPPLWEPHPVAGVVGPAAAMFAAAAIRFGTAGSRFAAFGGPQSAASGSELPFSVDPGLEVVGGSVPVLLPPLEKLLILPPGELFAVTVVEAFELPAAEPVAVGQVPGPVGSISSAVRDRDFA